MREIKFRAWDKEKKEILAQFMGGRIFVDMNKWGADRFELMQYTGLKDKNGVEIYEGDVLKVDFGHKTDIRKIVWNETYAGFYGEFNGGGECINYYSSSEVIGNIYENPELLDNK